MKHLKASIEQLENEIAQNWNLTQRQFHLVNKKIKGAITSPFMLVTAATTGAAIGRKIKTSYFPSVKNQSIKNARSFSAQKIVSILSEISTAVSLLNYLKKSFRH